MPVPAGGGAADVTPHLQQQPVSILSEPGQPPAPTKAVYFSSESSPAPGAPRLGESES